MREVRALTEPGQCRGVHLVARLPEQRGELAPTPAAQPCGMNQHERGHEEFLSHLRSDASGPPDPASAGQKPPQPEASSSSNSGAMVDDTTEGYGCPVEHLTDLFNVRVVVRAGSLLRIDHDDIPT